MAYDDMINRDDDAGVLIPEEIEESIFKALPESSIVMQLGRKLRNMTTHENELKVQDALVTAFFASPGGTARSGDDARLQTTDISWENVILRAAKIGAIVVIPENVLDDVESGVFDIWGEVQPQIVEALGIVFDAAVFHGTNAPSDWPDDLVTATTAKSLTVVDGTGADTYEDLMSETGVLALVEGQGYLPDGHVAGISMRSKLRGLRTAQGAPIYNQDMQGPTRYALDGDPLFFPRNGAFDTTAALLIAGDWQQLVYSMRQEVRFKFLDQASLYDGAGNVTHALAQEDKVAMKVTMRLGWQLPVPPNRIDATPYPFATLLPAP